MEKNDTRILLSLDTAWRPLHDAYTAIANTYGVSFVMRSMEPGCGIFYNTDDTRPAGSLWRKRLIMELPFPQKMP